VHLEVTSHTPILSIMKSLSLMLLHGAAVQAGYLGLMAPPVSPAITTVLGFLGIDLNNLATIDVAKFAPLLKPFLPMANSFADTGALYRWLHTTTPTLPLISKVQMEPVLRKTAKRAKVKLGPFTLFGKDVSYASTLHEQITKY
jgi:hypothetical protein